MCGLRECDSCLHEGWLFASEALEVTLLLQGWNGNSYLDWIGFTGHMTNSTARDNVIVIGLTPNKIDDNSSEPAHTELENQPYTR